MNVSVIIPIYNLPKYLRQCIDSALFQDFVDFEVILVDDGSTDECVAIVDEYAEKDGRVRVVHKKNGGLSSARNVGLDVAVGDYIIFLDSDDWWNDSGALATLYDAATRNGADVVRGEYRRSSEDGKEYADGHSLPPEKYRESVLDSFSFLKNVVRNEYFPWLYFFKRSSLRDIRFNESIKYQEDVDFVFHLFTLPLKCIYVPLDFYTYRFRSDSMIRMDSPVKLGYFFEIPFRIYSYGELCDSVEARRYYVRNSIATYQIAYTNNLAESPFYEVRRKIIKEDGLLMRNFQVANWIVKWGLLKQFSKLFLLLILTPYVSLPMAHYKHRWFQ